MNIQKSYFKLLLLLIGFFIFVINGCRKPEDNPDDGGIMPMYGVQQSTYQKMDTLEQNNIYPEIGDIKSEEL
ncbi:MAG: hypothetical protein PHR79_09240 [Bacteroidales bacterium]|nr:hypothetical protein [Bacteroidales bacterium]